MKTGIILLGTLVVTFIIISPFFWLRFLHCKDRKLYVLYSSLATAGVFILFVTYVYKYVLNKIQSYDRLYFFDGISMGSIYITLFLSIISPFIFTKIIKDKFNIKRFFVSLSLSVGIFVIYALVFAFILLPMALEGLNRSL